MQRAAASSPISSPQTPDQPSAKRQKFSNAPSPATPSADLQAIQAALTAEKAKRSEAIDRQAAEAGETKWVLSFRDEEGAINGHSAGNLRIVTNGYADIDRATEIDKHYDEPWRPLVVGRRSFGKFNRALEKRQGGSEDSSFSSDDEDDEDGSDDPAGTKALIKASKEEAVQRAKAERKARKKAEKAELARLAERRKSKEVKLNRLSSISGGGNIGGGGNPNMECFMCGQKGHGKKDCPQRQRKKRGEEVDSGGATSMKSRKT